MAKLKGHRTAQLRLLKQAGAVSRETAVAVCLTSAPGGELYRPGTLSVMISEGLVENDYLPFNGDSKRRVSHYWLTPAGLLALNEELA